MPANEPAIRLAVFALVFTGMAAWEWLAPCRPAEADRRRRWPANIGLVLLDTVLVRLAFPFASAGMALLAQEQGWGLFNLVSLPAWLAVTASVLLLDLAVYGQHVLLHAIPLFWRFHRVHHSDPAFDVTTGIRFHPGEIFLSLLFKFAMVIALGAPPLAVLLFELALNAGSLFSHSNVSLPPVLDRILRGIIVTPDMHRIHHSVLASEAGSNFGFALSWWDRLFATYKRQPAAGHQQMVLGQPEFRDAAAQTLSQLLLQPLRRNIRL